MHCQDRFCNNCKILWNTFLWKRDTIEGCPSCGSTRPPIIDRKSDFTFYPRRGCLDCDKWWEPVRCT